MDKRRIGVIVGRFQVPALHEGHKAILNSVYTSCDQMVIVLGVSPLDGRTRENPLTFNQRRFFFEYWRESIVVPLPDTPDDKTWSESLDTLLLSMFPNNNFLNDEITLYGGRESFKSYYTGKLYVSTQEFPLILSRGTTDRANIKESSDPMFLQGQIYGLMKQYPHAYPTVDIALFRGQEVLLIQRTDTGAWVLPGGFVDPTDASLEAAASRELLEEVGFTDDKAYGSMQYVMSTLIDDWRYRGTRDKIMTSLFATWCTLFEPNPNPLEVQDFRWITPEKGYDILASHHKPLLHMVMLTRILEKK